MFETTSQTWFPKMEVPQSQSTIGSRKKIHVMVITGMMTGVSHGKPILGNPLFFFFLVPSFAVNVCPKLEVSPSSGRVFSGK